MKKTLTLMLITASILLCSCDVVIETDKFPPEVITYHNNTDHLIEIHREGFGPSSDIGKVFEITAHDKKVIKIGDESVATMYSKKCVIIFDSSVKMDHTFSSIDLTYNFGWIGNYEYRGTSKEKYYTYTFTDADYQYALENGTILEF